VVGWLCRQLSRESNYLPVAIVSGAGDLSLVVVFVDSPQDLVRVAEDGHKPIVESVVVNRAFSLA
jgi:hypothetical protein